jgi:glycosyltransferase involved in cell wall biosynthesis
VEIKTSSNNFTVNFVLLKPHAIIYLYIVFTFENSSLAYDSEHSKILICIPAFNEAKNIENVIAKSKLYADEVIVYDDGSTDNTYQAASSAGATVIRNAENKGYGVAIRSLFQAAKEKDADIMVTLDSDGQHDPGQIPDLLKALSQGFDIVIGSRFLRNDDKEKVPKYRSFGIKTITKLTQVASYGKITDSQSGFRAYNKNALSKINLFKNGMSVSTEILLRASEKKLLTTEVPITIRYDMKDTSTHNPLSHGVSVLYSVMQFISLRHPLAFYGLPGIVLLGIAAFIMKNALNLFSKTGYVSTNMILIAVGIAVVGVVLLATAAIVYTLIALLEGKVKSSP